MSRLFKIVALAMLVVAVTASGAVAATLTASTSGGVDYDYKLASSAAWTISGTTIGSAVRVAYAPAIGVPAGSNVVLTLTGATFATGQTVYLSGASSTANSASATVSTAGASVTLTVNDALSSLGTYYITQLPSLNGTGAANAFPTIIIAAGHAADVKIAVTSVTSQVGAVIDAAVVATPFLKYTSTNTLTISGVNTASGVINVAAGKTSFSTVPVWTGTLAGAQTNGLGVTSTVAAFTYNLTITGDLSGISTVAFGSNASTTVTAAEILAGSKTISGTGAAFGNGVLSYAVDGTTALKSRTLNIAFSVTGTAERAAAAWTPSSSALGSSVMSNTWTSPEYEGIATNLLGNTTMPTYCLISNNAQAAMNVVVDFISAMKATTLPARYTPSTIPVGGSIQLKFDTSVTPTYRSGTGSAVALGFVDADWDKYTVKFSAWPVSGSISKDVVTIMCNQTDGTIKRIVPVFTGDATAGSPWRQ